MRLLTSIFILIYTSIATQQAEPVLFDEKTYDFGEIAEEGGSADHDFVFINNTGRVIKILSVQASCGCTTPGWTREPVLAGKKGLVRASFDPRGRPGYFNKSLTVTTDFDGNAITLQLKGQVISKKPDVATVDYPAANGSLRLKYNSFNVGKIFINREPASKEFPVYNGGGKPVNFNGKMMGPAYVKVEMPATLNPKEKGSIKVTYDARLRNQFGFVSDNVEIESDDELQPVKSFSIYATIEEYFPPLSPEELAKAPAMRLEVSEIDLGRIRQGNTMEREIVIRNIGKKELQIRSVQGNCTCVTASVEPKKMKPGEEGKLKFSLSTQGRSGLQQKAVTIYSSDPKNPVQRITITAYVESR